MTQTETKNPGTGRSVSPRPCCRSGKCHRCLEEARWDRLYRQNSADPYYYSRRQAVWPVTPLATAIHIATGGR